jgi:hypothetical protein
MTRGAEAKQLSLGVSAQVHRALGLSGCRFSFVGCTALGVPRRLGRVRFLAGPAANTRTVSVKDGQRGRGILLGCPSHLGMAADNTRLSDVRQDCLSFCLGAESWHA